MQTLQTVLSELISSLFDIPKDFPIDVTPAPALEIKGDFRADYSTNVAMQLAGTLHQNPRTIAEILVTEFSKTAHRKLPELTGVQTQIASPGFINFMLPDAFFASEIAKLTTNFAKNISCNAYSNKIVVTEFSDPNPFKVLHIGHLYTSIMGDSISRLIEFAGGQVHRVNFGGDVGLHVAKTLYALEKSGLQDFTIEDIANCYIEGTRAYEESETAQAEIANLNKEIYRISQCQLHDSKLAETYWHGRELSYAYFDDFYARLGIHFEKYYPESTVAQKGLDIVRSHPDVYETSSGATIFKGEPYGLHTRVFINAQGLPTYETKDVGLLFTKNDDYHFDQSIVITGSDIIDYMKVVLKSVAQYAPDLVTKTTHLTHGNVRLPGNQKMSSRKGNFIRAIDILNEVEEKAGSKQIGQAAIKYSLLKYKIGNNIEFNLADSISLTGNSGPYLLYSAVRANKILKEVGFLSWHEETGFLPSASEPSTASELNLMKSLLAYRSVLSDAVHSLAPHLLCSYLFDLAQTFSRFYESCRVKGDPREQSRAQLVALFAQIMTHGLGLLGITVPEEM